MPTRTLAWLSTFLWAAACSACVCLAVDTLRLDGARAAVWALFLLDTVAALLVSRVLYRRAAVAEDDAQEWRSKWGGEVGPYRLALARLVWAIEEARATPRYTRSVRVDAPDLLSRADRLARASRST